MNIAILGSSNSFRQRGYARIYEALMYPHTVKNFSLGGSNAAYACFSLLYNKLQNYDIIILDFQINESQKINLRNSSIEEIIQNYFYIFKFCSLNNIYPIVLLYFSRQFDNWQNTFYKIMQCILNKFNISYIDLRNIFSILNCNFDIFDDNYHLNETASVIVAFLIYKYTKYYLENKYTFYFENAKSNSFCLAKKFSLFDMRYNFSNKLQHYGNSSIDYECYSINNSDKQSISLPINNKFLEGILIYSLKNYSFYASFSNKIITFDKVINKQWDAIFTFDIFTPKLFISDRLVIYNTQQFFPKFGYTTFDNEVQHENDNQPSLLVFPGLLLSSFYDEKIYFDFSCYSECSSLYDDIEYARSILDLIYKYNLLQNSYKSIIISIFSNFENISDNVMENPFYLLECAKYAYDNEKLYFIKLLTNMNLNFDKYNAYFLLDLGEVLKQSKCNLYIDIYLYLHEKYPCNSHITNILSEYFHNK